MVTKLIAASRAVFTSTAQAVLLLQISEDVSKFTNRSGQTFIGLEDL